ncbi:MAG: hydantoinase/oxoprolinase family protein [Deltaproteobacteria bacterium]|nr:hydantoinase/oxoprolinase family protein [Deltaproteobacteria bacterium]MBW2153574.1 hydantoinase/oxoprolinase family protein [Deltaproteobacteria bacterium]
MIIGLDVGGTHTDAVLLGKQGLVREKKVPTDPADLFSSVLKGLESVMEGIDPEKIHRVVLSTTLTTNAIIQNNLPPVGMIIMGGPGIDPEFYRTNHHYYTVSGSIDHRGRVIQPVKSRHIREIGSLLKAEGIRFAGVVGKFSVRNPEHELSVKEILKNDVEKVFLGHQISGNLNFPRRIATTYLNAAVYPIHKKFFEAVEKSLEIRGLCSPIRILKADGGNMKFESSIDHPGLTILSGPAASVMGSIGYAAKGMDSLVIDIGGTTTDMAILIDRVPLLDALGIELAGYKTLIRSLETHSVGIGGDSEVKIQNGTLVVGPQRRGPAMAFGGPVPTPTDALFVLNKMQGGDREKSIKGFKPIAGKLGFSLEETARRVFDLTCQRILEEAGSLVHRINSKPVYTVHELHEGYRVNPGEILVLGGPAPCFAGRLDGLSDNRVRVVPNWKVANAIGAALARTTCEVTLFADTEQQFAYAPEEGFRQKVSKSFDRRDAVKLALKLLREKALKIGANLEYLETDIIEDTQFNMVRGFYATGKNIRIKVQIRPALIHGFESLLQRTGIED